MFRNALELYVSPSLPLGGIELSATILGEVALCTMCARHACLQVNSTSITLCYKSSSKCHGIQRHRALMFSMIIHKEDLVCAPMEVSQREPIG
jgi:hypothetical protein